MRSDSLALRQVDPAFKSPDGSVTSQVFKPMPEKDQGLLSAYNSELISPTKAYTHFTETRGGRSAGVLGVEVAEVNELGLQVREDPSEFNEHAVVDMAHLSKGQVDRPAKAMRAAAVKRGWLHQP